MQIPVPFRLVSLCGALAVGAVLWSGSAGAQGTADIDAQYQRDVARCNTGQTNQDRATCLREAGAARDEARRGRLRGNEMTSDYQKNALERCRRLPASQQQDCITATTSPSKTQGSVGGGGVLRESVITIPAEPAAPAAPVAPTAPSAPAAPAPGTVVPQPVR